MSNTRPSTEGAQKYQQDQEDEIFEIQNANDDFDQLNEEKFTYNKYSTAFTQQNQHIDQSETDHNSTMQHFNNESQQNLVQRQTLQKSRQTQIGNRLIQIRQEMLKLSNQLNNNKKRQDEMQQQAQAAVKNVKTEKQEGESSQAGINLKLAKKKYEVADDQIKQFTFLKQKLFKLYQMQGFKQMVRTNPNMSQFLGVIQQDFIRDGEEDNMISAQITKRSVNMMEFGRMIEKLKYTHSQTQQEKEQWKQNPQVQINIMYDKSQKDIGVLIRLNNLMKRIELVKYLIGNWKPTTKKYSTITDQMKYIQKKLEILDENKIMYFQGRAQIVKQEVEDLRSQGFNDQDKLQQIQSQLGHDKKTIDGLYNTGKSVKNLVDQIPQIIDRLDQKKKVHNMAAQILVSIEKIEQQQNSIINLAGKDNKDLLEALTKGIKDNQGTIQNNIYVLKQKMGIKVEEPKPEAEEAKQQS